MEEDEAILREVEQQKQAFGTTCRKLCGALTSEILRSHIVSHGFTVSPRDVFIRGLGAELDLMVVRPGATPTLGVVYEPSDVLAVLEVKNHGAFGPQTAENTRHVFDRVTKVAAHVFCCYLSLLERKGYPHAVTDHALGYPAFTMFLHSGSGRREIRTSTGDWNRFLAELRRSTRGPSASSGTSHDLR